jgi:hypothetical protein
MIRNRFVLLALFLFPLLLRPQNAKPVWQIDLSSFGYQGRPPAALAHLRQDVLMHFGSGIYQQGVAFTSPNVAVAYFVVHDDPPGASGQREPALSDPFRLVAVFLNAKNGELIKQLDWPLPTNLNSGPSAFFCPATQGRFVVGLGNSLRLYSPDFKLLAHFDSESDLYPITSPSGESLLLSTEKQVDGQWTTSYQLLDAGNLSVRNSWVEPNSHLPHSIEALWNDQVAWASQPLMQVPMPGPATNEMPRRSPPSVFVKTPVSPRKELPLDQGNLCGGWKFVSKDELAGPLCGGANRVLTVSTEGKIGLDFDLGFEQTDGPVVASASGRRFAVPTLRWGSGDSQGGPDQLTARVFGLGGRDPLLRLNVLRKDNAGTSTFYGSNGDILFGWGGLALSPEGGLLAVKSGASVLIYQVPDVATPSQCAPNCNNQTKAANPQPLPSQAASTAPAAVPGPSSQLIGEMLSWFPADTETVTAVMGPLPLQKFEKGPNGVLSMVKSDNEMRDQFMLFPTLLLKDPGNDFKDRPILATIEGSRGFLPPTGLGGMRYQGALIAVFAGDITDRVSSFLKDPSSANAHTEQIEGHAVTVSQSKSEEDVLTTYVAFPKPNIAVVATDRGYLEEVLARIDGKNGERALPDTLPEWKHVDTHAQFWAVRHYRKAGAERDPSSPSNGGWGKTSDPQAIGLTFSFDPDKSKTAILTYLSGDGESLQRLQGYFGERTPAITQMHARYRQVEPGVFEGTYDVDQMESAGYFVFILESLLGHAIYV